MCWKWFVLTVLYLLVLQNADAGLKNQYHQTDYTVKLEIIEIININQTYVRNCTCGLHWHNRTTRVINGRGMLLKDIGQKSWFNIQMYKFLSNEYRYFPISIAFTCTNAASNTFGIGELFTTYSNIPSDCNVKKGFYEMRNGIYDYSTLPPYMPSGRYKLESKLYNDKDYVFTLQIFCEIIEIKNYWN